MATTITQPSAGFTSMTGGAIFAVRNMVQVCDTGDTDAHVPGDAGASYVATVRSRPFYFSGLMNKQGVMAGSLMAQALPSGKVSVRLVKDYGDESFSLDVDLSPETVEDTVMALLDSLSLSEMSAAQLEFADSTTLSEWQLYQFGLKPRPEQTS